MTIIYIDTHLTTDPVYNLEEYSATFNIALSTLHIECRIYREENIKFLRQNQIRTGDLIRIHGIFVTGSNQLHYIKVHYVTLINTLLAGKKRKVDDIAFSGSGISSTTADDDTDLTTRRSPSMMSTDSGSSKKNLFLESYTGIQGPFSDYFFMLMGKTYFYKEALDSYYRSQTREKLEAIRQVMESNEKKVHFLYDLMTQVHTLYSTFMTLGLNKLNVVNFVNTITIFVERLTDLRKTCPYDFLPEFIFIDTKVPLPFNVYDFYVNHMDD